MKKTILFITLIALVCVCVYPLSSCYSIQEGGLLFTPVEGGYQVTGAALSDRFYMNFSVTIPSEFNGKPVVAISNLAFAGYTPESTRLEFCTIIHATAPTNRTNKPSYQNNAIKLCYNYLQHTK